MQNSEFVDEYMLIYEQSMDHDITLEARKELEDQLIQLVDRNLNKSIIGYNTFTVRVWGC